MLDRKLFLRTLGDFLGWTFMFWALMAVFGPSICRAQTETPFPSSIAPWEGTIEVREGRRFFPFHILEDSSSHAWINARMKNVSECSGVSDTSKSPFKIKWFVRDTLTFAVKNDLGTQAYQILGEFAPPDSIFITWGYLDETYVIEHELAHYNLWPSIDTRRHQPDPFWKCNWMPDQHKPRSPDPSDYKPLLTLPGIQ